MTSSGYNTACNNEILHIIMNITATKASVGEQNNGAADLMLKLPLECDFYLYYTIVNYSCVKEQKN